MNDDEKMRAELKETIDDMAPDQKQRDRIWNRIEEKMDGTEDQSDVNANMSAEAVRGRPSERCANNCPAIRRTWRKRPAVSHCHR